MNGKIIYLAGPISDPDFMAAIGNLHVFFEAERRLIRKGYTVINPAADLIAIIMDGEITYEMVTSKDFPLISACHAVYMLPGWGGSTGACKELAMAVDIGKPVVISDAELDALWEINWVDDLPVTPDD